MTSLRRHLVFGAVVSMLLFSFAYAEPQSTIEFAELGSARLALDLAYAEPLPRMSTMKRCCRLNKCTFEVDSFLGETCSSTEGDGCNWEGFAACLQAPPPVLIPGIGDRLNAD